MNIIYIIFYLFFYYFVLFTINFTGLGEVMANPLDEVDVPASSTSGIFEASHIAAPVLPQYHPRQLMELLNSGKIRRVKAILAHLVR